MPDLLDAPSPPASVPRPLLALLVLVALLAILVPALIVRNAPQIAPAPVRIVKPTRVVPKAELPPVEPIVFQKLAPVDAQAFNATVPFSTAPNPPARPFVLSGAPEDRARALDCLAAAVLYEAGDDGDGQRAVAQVVLNRVRHPAYPNSICGVVFQGSERSTGCQFTFTCDGALNRQYSTAAWERARATARLALNGRVDRRVGQATHYHTNWVVPYWSSSLDKIVEIKTHLFFRWSGWWGTPGAFRSRYAGAEMLVPKMARLSTVHGPAADGAMMPVVIDPALLGDAATPKGLEQDGSSFLVTLDPRLAPAQFPALAAKACGERPYCKFMAWSSKAATPATLPVTPQQQRVMSFSYLRDRAYGFEKALWNCTEYKGVTPNQCMKAQLAITMAPVPPADMKYDSTPGSVLRAIAGTSQPARPTGPDPLTGVRRKTEPADAGPMPGNTTAAAEPKANPKP